MTNEEMDELFEPDPRSNPVAWINYKLRTTQRTNGEVWASKSKIEEAEQGFRGLATRYYLNNQQYEVMLNLRHALKKNKYKERDAIIFSNISKGKKKTKQTFLDV